MGQVGGCVDYSKKITSPIENGIRTSLKSNQFYLLSDHNIQRPIKKTKVYPVSRKLNVPSYLTDLDQRGVVYNYFHIFGLLNNLVIYISIVNFIIFHLGTFVVNVLSGQDEKQWNNLKIKMESNETNFMMSFKVIDADLTSNSKSSLFSDLTTLFESCAKIFQHPDSNDYLLGWCLKEVELAKARELLISVLHTMNKHEMALFVRNLCKSFSSTKLDLRRFAELLILLLQIPGCAIEIKKY